MQDITIEHLAISDYEDVFQFWNSCGGLHMHRDYSETPEGFSRVLDRNPGLSFVARDDEKIIGAVLGSHDGRRGFINHLAVSSHYREKGIGRLLVHNVIESLKSIGVRKILIFVLKNSPDSQAFWKHIGFSKEEIIDTQSIVV